MFALSFELREIVFYAHDLSLRLKARKPLLQIGFKLAAHRSSAAQHERGAQGEARAGGVAHDGGCDIGHGVAFHLAAADGREGVAGTGEEQAQVVVNLRGGAHRGARVAAGHFLFYGNGGRQAFDVVAFGFVHASQKLPGVSRQALDVTALAFGVERVESQ